MVKVQFDLTEENDQFILLEKAKRKLKNKGQTINKVLDEVRKNDV